MHLSTHLTGRAIFMDLADGNSKAGFSPRKEDSVKSLEKALADYEKAKERMEASKARYENDLKRFKAAESDKIEAENLEIIRIIRGMDMSISDLEAFKMNMKNGLPFSAVEKKEDTDQYDEFIERDETRNEDWQA